ncbi:31438_t:CDS:2, partial [Gigaspora margarita]
TSTATDMEKMLKYKDFFGFMLQEAIYPDQELKQRISKTDRSIAKWLASNKEITEKEQYFFNTIETEEDETKKFNQNILLATKCGTRDYEIEELENQIENSKSEKVQNISNQPNTLSQELLYLDNYNQESTIDEPRSKNATSSPSLSIEEKFTRETLSINKNKINASAILKKDVISLSRIYKSLKCQYKTTKAANLSEDVVADFNYQVREINEKYGLEIRLSSNFSAEDSLAEIKRWSYSKPLARRTQPFDLKIWQNNLNCQIIYKAKELNLTIRHEPNFWKIHGTGPRFRE